MDTIFYQRFLSKLVMLMALAMLTAALASMLAAGLFYAAYVLLVRHGLEPDAAFVTVGIGVALLASVSAAFTAGYIRKLRHALQPLSPLASGIGDIAGAFVDGLRVPRNKEMTP